MMEKCQTLNLKILFINNLVVTNLQEIKMVIKSFLHAHWQQNHFSFKNLFVPTVLPNPIMKLLKPYLQMKKYTTLDLLIILL